MTSTDTIKELLARLDTQLGPHTAGEFAQQGLEFIHRAAHEVLHALETRSEDELEAALEVGFGTLHLAFWPFIGDVVAKGRQILKELTGFDVAVAGASPPAGELVVATEDTDPPSLSLDEAVQAVAEVVQINEVAFLADGQPGETSDTPIPPVEEGNE